ncbi:tyrosine-type recombinase/integrase [Clostridium sp. DJ247]|uniref:tyrosine-type recombinase/integrase n=1 Tax=Clostridium sp. DJ247 TaxID=2726188 RepID=UPI001629843B|nr:tyrosine-type recombinase/integrase [Clostridium sp. DJ247]MBC2579059.1 tyrosine-type recombinase/integrase [Clostridium sp. DJ247]
MILTAAVEQFRKYLLLLERSNETIKCYLMDLKYFNQYLLDKYNFISINLESITSDDVQDFLYYILSEKHYAPNSRRRSLNSIKSFYNYCIKRKLCMYNITNEIDHIKIWQRERTFLTETEISTLLCYVKSPLLKILISTLYYTGLRIGECTHLELDHVDLQNDIIYVKCGKGKKDRNIPVSKKLKIILSSYIRHVRGNTESNRFFYTRTGSISPSYVNRILHLSTKEAGIGKHVTAHILRHYVEPSIMGSVEYFPCVDEQLL